MARGLSDWLPSMPSRKNLEDTREALEVSISYPIDDRRSEARLTVPHRPRLPRPTGAGFLRDLSPSGMALEEAGVCRYARGEQHKLTLGVGLGTVEVQGDVQWTRSFWKRSDNGGRSTFVQAAGLRFSDGLRRDSREILRILRELVEMKGVAVEIRDSEILCGCCESKKTRQIESSPDS